MSKPRREALEALSGSQRQRDGPERPCLLPVQLQLAVCEDAAHVDDPIAGVDVATFERGPLFRPETSQASEQRDRREAREKLTSDKLEFRDRLERRDLPALRFGVRDELRRVLVEQLHPHGVGEHLPECLVDRPGGAFRQPFPPGADRVRVDPVDPGVAEVSVAYRSRARRVRSVFCSAECCSRYLTSRSPTRRSR